MNETIYLAFYAIEYELHSVYSTLADALAASHQEEGLGIEQWVLRGGKYVRNSLYEIKCESCNKMCVLSQMRHDDAGCIVCEDCMHPG